MLQAVSSFEQESCRCPTGMREAVQAQTMQKQTEQKRKQKQTEQKRSPPHPLPPREKRLRLQLGRKAQSRRSRKCVRVT